ncbi:DNA mismatch repair protein MutS [Faecalibacillus intestinalis]|jgi:DNA mismatch repair protein MutS|uniref:DNA mismatch repair protein MutS n=2 Tax=Faecalibacillus intestinalis TaxID=1982626 RepID=A0AAW4VK94_9FIRM|nr:DNA mismatch repair protein MutS [Faecalibacillus intestinalis]RGF54814.1 DNA mismatch repair protein MutS [Coprobacillus sp. AF36-10BH]RGG05407.1 DNA mismatch repair protein MutS [Coprobacillus sp. AF27-24BH]RGG27268.1 DNA mismatch repair protein MutS [Coprobacillus sp. AF24-1LB]RGH49436.1 DNA mismatch repair protein MutS [Coprobacillus sp. AM37-9BH]RGH98910.1 DNA mismatch repair protein MutS [Coprobacillus sp. AM26-5AC]RGI21549.1 DNA mismatch repair protein MutS [Coprobacillus sp. OM08-1
MKQKYSPMMMQYLGIKEQNKDAIVMFRLGDFYEMFFDDAMIVSKELELALTGKNAGAKERVPMCGVPFHSASGYIQKLVDNGHKVAIVEQLTDPGKKGIVERGVVQIVTPGTIFDESMTKNKNNYIACMMIFDFVYTLAFCDITTGEFQVVNIDKKDHLLNNQLASMEVKEIVVKSDCTYNFNDSIMVSHYDNETFNEKYRDIFHNIKDLKEIKVSTLLLNYLIETQKRDLEHLQMIEEINNQDFMTMDLYTKKSLELTENSKDHEKYGSLFWLLDMTKSAMGARLLKNYIDRPLLKKEAIEERLDIVEIFTQQFIQRESIKEILKEIYDLERLSSRIAFGNINARDLKWIASSLKVLPELKQQLYSFNEPLTDQLANQIIDLSHITKLIDDAIIDNPPLTIKEGNIIKDHFNEELDELRYLRDHGKQWLVDFEQKEREKTGIKNLKVGYNRVFGYYIEVTKGSLDLVKDEFEYTRKQSLSNAERFITPELKDMESKILSAQDKIQKLEYVLFTQVRNEIKKEVHLIQDVSKIIARVDVYQSLAMLASENSYVRPVFNDQKIMDIKEGRHGVIEKVMGHGKYVPNDVSIDENSPVVLITGPNMGGKSTYMRQVALIVIMAQIGSFVPAKYANLTIFDQIFTRIGASDDLISGQSTFMVEMLEANNALRFASEKSLILFDEIGRGTATFDGMAIAQAMIEYIASEIHCMTLFSTHYHELTFLEDKGLGIQNVHASARVDNDHLVFEYLIKKGRSNKSYGVNVAKLAKLPDEVINRANLVLETLEENNVEDRLIEEKQVQVIEKESEVEKYLKTIDPMALSPLDALSTLIELKKLVK